MSTPLFPAGSPDVLYLIDLSGYVFRAYHAIAPLTSPSGEPTQAVFGTVNMLEKLVRQRRPALLAVAMDSKTPTFRKRIYAEYKAHRPPPPPDLSQQMVRCREIVSAFAIPVFQQDGFEADDLIAAAVKQARQQGIKVVIVSADKDLMQLVGDDVVLWDTMRDKVFGPPEVEERFGVPVAQVRDWLALTGDASDNVPGVPSVGPKTATELLSRFHDLDGIFRALAEVERKGLREKLRENEEAARLSQHLVTLDADAPCSFDPVALQYGGRDVARLRELYRTLGFMKHLAALETETEPTPQPGGSVPPSMDRPSATSLAASATVVVSDAAALADLSTALVCGARFAVVAETSAASAVTGAVVGLGFAVPDGRSFYVPLGHRYFGAPEQLTRDAVMSSVRPPLSRTDIMKATHDAKRLIVVLARHHADLGGPLFDAHLAGYLLDPETPHDLESLARQELGLVLASPASLVPKARGREAGFEEARVEDAAQVMGARANALLSLSDRLGPKLVEEGVSKVMEDIELPLTRLLARMEQAGVLVDSDLLKGLGRRIEKELEALELEAHRVAGRVFNVNAPRQLETLLFDELGLKPIKRTKTSRSTDADTLEALTDQHALPKVVLEIRQLSKLKGTYIDTLPTLVNPETGRIHTRWDQAVAATGRLSSADPNLQNIPIRSELGRAIRGAFVAPPGTELVSADYSQIELRVLAHLSKDPVLMDAFETGQDVHTRTAMEIFGLTPDQVTSEHRRRAKAVNFGVIYGQGDSGLAKSLGIPRAEASSFIASYFRKYEGVRRFMNEVLESARAAGSVRTLFGRRRLVPDIRSENRAKRLAAERIVMNTPIQGTAADLMKLAMLALAEPPVPGARMVLTVHDELVFEVPEAAVMQAIPRIREAMATAFPLSVPLVVDVGHGKDWSQAH